jgi:hypothetical protein
MYVEILNPEGTMESVNWSVGNGSPVERKEVVSVDFRLLDYFVIKEAVPATDESEALDAIQELRPVTAVQKLRFPSPMTAEAIQSAVEERATELAGTMTTTAPPLTVVLP